jgi:catechol 2,3-dioxygenase-like lactoylglutathione lyase family enzyme
VTETAPVSTATPSPTLLGTDHVELWVGNARQAAHFYRSAFGFDVVVETQNGRHVEVLIAALVAAGFPTHLLPNGGPDGIAS